GDAVAGHGTEMLEAPVTGSKLGAERGTLLFMTGGPRPLHDALLPLLLDFGSRAIYCGEMGQASTVKLVGNTLISFMLEGLCEGATVARKDGAAPGAVLEAAMAA